MQQNHSAAFFMEFTLEADQAQKPKGGPSSYILCLAVICPPSGARLDVTPKGWT